MNHSDFNNHVLIQTAISSLKNAYGKCSDLTAQKSILAALNAIIQLHHGVDIIATRDRLPDSDDGLDHSEYCAAV